MTHGSASEAFNLANYDDINQSYTYSFSSSLPLVFTTDYGVSSASTTPYQTNAINFIDATSMAQSQVALAIDRLMAASGITIAQQTSGTADINIIGLNLGLYQLYNGINPSDPIGGFAYGPSASSAWASDFYLTPASHITSTGSTVQEVVSHEFNHTIGLKDYATTSLYKTDVDWGGFSIMSSRRVHSSVDPRFGDELQLYDIAALQSIYGRSENHNDDDNYSGTFFLDSSSNARMFCLWDSDGWDKIDASGQAGAALIDLRPGYFSSIGPSSNVETNASSGNAVLTAPGILNLSIAFGTYIEDAIGTDHHDFIIGNVLSNNLFGGDGDDVIYSEGFNSSYDPGDGDYRQITNSSASLYFEAAPTGVIETVDDPSSQWDFIVGGAGNDILVGGRGVDEFLEGEGDDYIDGGAGIDFVNFTEYSEGITFSFGAISANATISTNDIVKNVEGIYGSNYNDTIDSINGEISDSGVGYQLYGGVGNDILKSGAEDDALYGGDGNDLLIQGIDGSGTSRDALQGNEGDDILVLRGDGTAEGGQGADQFWIEEVSADTPFGHRFNFIIRDSEPDDTLFWNGHQLLGGGPVQYVDAEVVSGSVIAEVGSVDTYGAVYKASSSSTMLEIYLPNNASITIFDFEQGDFGIFTPEIQDSDLDYMWEFDNDGNPYTTSNLAVSSNAFNNDLWDLENLPGAGSALSVRGLDVPTTFLPDVLI